MPLSKMVVVAAAALGLLASPQLLSAQSMVGSSNKAVSSMCAVEWGDAHAAAAANGTQQAAEVCAAVLHSLSSQLAVSVVLSSPTAAVNGGTTTAGADAELQDSSIGGVAGFDHGKPITIPLTLDNGEWCFTPFQCDTLSDCAPTIIALAAMAVCLSSFVANVALGVKYHKLLGKQDARAEPVPPGTAVPVGVAVRGTVAGVASVNVGSDRPGGRRQQRTQAHSTTVSDSDGTSRTRAARSMSGASSDESWVRAERDEQDAVIEETAIHHPQREISFGRCIYEFKQKRVYRAVLQNHYEVAIKLVVRARPGSPAGVGSPAAAGCASSSLSGASSTYTKDAVVAAIAANDARVDFEDLMREAVVLHKLQHPNVIRTYGVVSWVRTPDGCEGFGLATEYCRYGSLKGVLADQSFALSLPLRLHLARGVAAGLQYLHGRHIMHRDLKSSNILLNEHWEVKVIDFGNYRGANGKRSVTHHHRQRNRSRSTRTTRSTRSDATRSEAPTPGYATGAAAAAAAAAAHPSRDVRRAYSASVDAADAAVGRVVALQTRQHEQLHRRRRGAAGGGGGAPNTTDDDDAETSDALDFPVTPQMAGPPHTPNFVEALSRSAPAAYAGVRTPRGAGGPGNRGHLHPRNHNDFRTPDAGSASESAGDYEVEEEEEADEDLDNESELCLTTKMGTVRYLAPELFTDTLDRYQYDSVAAMLSSDVYSFGVVLWEIFTRAEPWYEQRHSQFSIMRKVVDERQRPSWATPPVWLQHLRPPERARTHRRAHTVGSAGGFSIGAPPSADSSLVQSPQSPLSSLSPGVSPGVPPHAGLASVTTSGALRAQQAFFRGASPVPVPVPPPAVAHDAAADDDLERGGSGSLGSLDSSSVEDRGSGLAMLAARAARRCKTHQGSVLSAAAAGAVVAVEGEEGQGRQQQHLQQQSDVDPVLAANPAFLTQLQRLADACWAHDPNARADFAGVRAWLERLTVDFTDDSSGGRRSASDSFRSPRVPLPQRVAPGSGRAGPEGGRAEESGPQLERGPQQQQTSAAAAGATSPTAPGAAAAGASANGSSRNRSPPASPGGAFDRPRQRSRRRSSNAARDSAALLHASQHPATYGDHGGVDDDDDEEEGGAFAEQARRPRRRQGSGTSASGGHRQHSSPPVGPLPLDQAMGVTMPAAPLPEAQGKGDTPSPSSSAAAAAVSAGGHSSFANDDNDSDSVCADVRVTVAGLEAARAADLEATDAASGGGAAAAVAVATAAGSPASLGANTRVRLVHPVSLRECDGVVVGSNPDGTCRVRILASTPASSDMDVGGGAAAGTRASFPRRDYFGHLPRSSILRVIAPVLVE